MVVASIKLAFVVYLVLAVIAFAVAGMIKLMSSWINRNGKMANQEELKLSTRSIVRQNADRTAEP